MSGPNAYPFNVKARGIYSCQCDWN